MTSQVLKLLYMTQCCPDKTPKNVNSTSNQISRFSYSMYNLVTELFTSEKKKHLIDFILLIDTIQYNTIL